MKDRNLIFIISQPRSGSTVLQAILSNNDLVGTVSEPWILLPFIGLNKKELNNSIYDSDLALSAINEFKAKVGEQQFDEDLSEFLCKQYAKILKGKEKFVLDKTPRYYEILTEIVHFFPEAKIIILKRNPLAVLNSIIETWNVNSLEHLLKFKRDLLVAPLLIQNFLDRNGNSKNIIEVRYEDLIENPQDTVGVLYKWIGMDFSSHVLDYSNNTKHQGSLGDQIGIGKFSNPTTSSLHKWKSLYKNKSMSRFAKGYAHYLSVSFLDKYGEYGDVESKKNKFFDDYLEMSQWNFDIKKIPTKKLLKKAILKKLGGRT